MYLLPATKKANYQNGFYMLIFFPTGQKTEMFCNYDCSLLGLTTNYFVQKLIIALISIYIPL